MTFTFIISQGIKHNVINRCSNDFYFYHLTGPKTPSCLLTINIISLSLVSVPLKRHKTVIAYQSLKKKKGDFYFFTQNKQIRNKYLTTLKVKLVKVTQLYYNYHVTVVISTISLISTDLESIMFHCMNSTTAWLTI